MPNRYERRHGKSAVAERKRARSVRKRAARERLEQGHGLVRHHFKEKPWR